MAIFIDGLNFYKPSEKSADFVKGKITIHREKLIEWLQGAIKYENEKGYIKVDLLKSKPEDSAGNPREAKLYLAVNTYVAPVPKDMNETHNQDWNLEEDIDVSKLL